MGFLQGSHGTNARIFEFLDLNLILGWLPGAITVDCRRDLFLSSFFYFTMYYTRLIAKRLKVNQCFNSDFDDETQEVCEVEARAWRNVMRRMVVNMNFDGERVKKMFPAIFDQYAMAGAYLEYYQREAEAFELSRLNWIFCHFKKDPVGVLSGEASLQLQNWEHFY